jgi:Flavin-binding monooxygenase-like
VRDRCGIVGDRGVPSVLAERGIEFDCFERGSAVGGNWRYENDNGMSSAYRSLHINTSRRQMEYAAYPMPDDYPDYPHHTQIAAYFDDYVDHFGLRDRIRFLTTVTSVEPAPDGGWKVDTEDGAGGVYGAVLVANGHHWNPRWPEPPFPGEFDGLQIHAHDYRTADGCEGRNVLVLGIGNSACDIAVEISRVSAMTYLAMRRYLGEHAPEGLGEVSCPAMIAWGTRDYLLPARQARRFAEQLPHGELCFLPGLGHSPMADDPELVSELILAFAGRASA